MAISADASELIPIHVGLREPVVAPPVLGGDGTGPRLVAPPRDIPLLREDFDWASHGVTPRWIGMESSDCPAAIEPNRFHNQGGDELERFLAGAASRREPAVVVATIGNVNDDRPRGVMARGDASVGLPADQFILGRRTPAHSTISLVPGVGSPERDLGLRLRNRPRDAPWWELSLHGYVGPGTPSEPTGTLQPILVDGLGQPVVAVWVSDAGDQRWHLVPDVADWGSILDWLVTQALPEFAPAVLRQRRSPLLRDPELMTAAESEAQAALDALEDEYERRRQALQEQLDAARAQADPIRDGLLYGTSNELVQAVAAVLTDAGITTTDLDALLGDTSSADLLAQLGARRRLIEVKSASGNANEVLMGHLENHLANWPPDGQDSVEGGVLVVNHQHRLPPAERSALVYERPEFVRSLRAPVISTRQLFEWWRSGAFDQIREAIFPVASGPATAGGGGPQASTVTTPAHHAPPRRPWRRDR